MIEADSSKQMREETAHKPSDGSAFINSRAGAESSKLVSPRDTASQAGEVGSTELAINGDGFRVLYQANLRDDRLSTMVQRSLPNGSIETRLEFGDRADGLKTQSSIIDRSGNELISSQFKDGRRVEIDRKLGRVLNRREFDSAGNLVSDDEGQRRSERHSDGSKPENEKRESRRADVVKPADARPSERIERKPMIEVRAGESIQRAIDKAPEGSVIHVQPGIYRERLNISRDNIILMGDGKAVLDLQDNAISGGAIQISNRRNVTIDGFEIRNVRGGDTPTGIAVDGRSRDISILNNDVHHVESIKDAHGISVYGDGKEPIRNIRIEGNKVHHLKLGTSESVVINGNVDGFKILNNKVHDNDNIGIDVIGGERISGSDDRARRGVIANNEVWNIDVSGRRSAAGIYVDGGREVLIENNKIRNATYGVEIASERKGWNTEQVDVRGNRIENSRLAGITLGGGDSSNGGVTGSTVENNDLRGNKKPIWKQNNVGRNVVIKNNRF